MESEEVLNYYISEVNDSTNIIEVEEEPVLNEAEQASDFLQKIGLSDLTNLYNQGKSISENLINDSVREKHLTERQAETVRSRIRTLNKTLQNRQPRRKHRQDIRDIAWNVETSSTGTRSRSATPDSLDSIEISNYDHTSDDDQQLSSLPPLFGSSLDPGHQVYKTKIKWTSSEPIQNKKMNRNDRADVAHLGSENVVLKGYQQLNEYGTLPKPQKEPSSNSSNEQTTDEVQFKQLENQDRHSLNVRSDLTEGHSSAIENKINNCSKVYLNGEESNSLSFEGIVQQNKFNQLSSEKLDWSDGVNIDQFTDSEYQYLKPLLYVELVTIFDQYKLTFMKRKSNTKSKGGNVFGVNLSTLVMRDMTRPTDNIMVPEIFKSVINQLNKRCLNEDGILRIAGQKQKLEYLFNEIETKFYTNRQDVELLLQQSTGHELTGILKKLLRDLPDPILTMELFDMFYKTSLIPNLNDKVKALNLLVLMLPIEHRNTYRLLLQFLLNVIENEDKNRMGLHNVAMITAPSFFPPRLLLPKENKLIVKQLSKDELTKQINGAAVCCCIMETMLKTGNRLWIIPNYLAQQARESQRKAQDRKDNNKERKFRLGKTKLVRSSTQYEAGAMNTPRIRRDILI